MIMQLNTIPSFAHYFTFMKVATTYIGLYMLWWLVGEVEVEVSLSALAAESISTTSLPLIYFPKAVLLQAWNGPDGSRRLRFPDFMTMAQDGGKVVSPMHQPPLPPGNAPGTHFC
jgi:hypothetical protein